MVSEVNVSSIDIVLQRREIGEIASTARFSN